MLGRNLFRNLVRDRCRDVAIAKSDFEADLKSAQTRGAVDGHGDRAVWDGVDVARVVADDRAARVDLNHLPGSARDGDRVAHGVLVLDEDEHAVEDVFDQGLSAESDGDANDADAGDQRGHIQAQLTEEQPKPEEAEDDAEGPVERGGERAGAPMNGRRVFLADAHCPADGAREHAADHAPKDDLGGDEHSGDGEQADAVIIDPAAPLLPGTVVEEEQRHQAGTNFA